MNLCSFAALIRSTVLKHEFLKGNEKKKDFFCAQFISDDSDP